MHSQQNKTTLKTILLFGAGKSATVLIEYLINQAENNNWNIIIADADIKLIQSKTAYSTFVEPIQIDISKDEQRSALIKRADIVISMMPPTLHFLVAKDCVAFKKNLLTASYVDEQLKSLKTQIEKEGLLFLCEMGLDPGIDHMSAMKLIEEIKADGGEITSFISHCGGLIAPESDNNPWHYKVSWNPRNIVLAGNAGAVYKKENETIKLDYHQVFENCEQISQINIPELTWYANRDSLSYIALYNLNDAETFIRTTLRYPAFCRGWDYIVNLGLTDTEDYDNIIDCETFEDWLLRKLFLVEDREMGLEEYAQLYVDERYEAELIEQFTFLGLLSNQKIPKAAQCSADILQNLIENKLTMQTTDKDMVVMLHQIKYLKNGVLNKVASLLKVIGTDSLRTAMAKTVGLPLGIATKLILNNTIKLSGLHIPNVKEIYLPILKELEEHGVIFNDEHNT